MAAASRELVIVVDETKLVEKLGTFPLPVEVVPFGVEFTRRRIEKLGCKTSIRMRNEKDYYQTDNGNYIIDCEFGRIEDPEELNQALNMIPGVVENGLFIKLAARVLAGRKNGEIDIIKRIER